MRHKGLKFGVREVLGDTVISVWKDSDAEKIESML